MSILGSFTALAAEVWRKYVTDGVPASGLHSPDLVEIVRWGTDVEIALASIAGASSRIHTAVGDVTFAQTEDCIIVKKLVGAATNVNIPAAAARALDLIIKDGKGDANTNPITPVFAGSDTCDGLTGASLQITTPYGILWMRVLPDGSGYFQMPSQL